MRVVKTSEEMLALVRRLRGFDDFRSDCSVEYTEGLKVDEGLLADLRDRYLALLDEGAEEYLSPELVTGECELSTVGTAVKACRLSPPSTCRRVLTARLYHWKREARVLPSSEFERVCRAQLNPYTAATVDSPVAVASMRGPAPDIFLWPSADSNIAVSVVGITDKGPGLYVLDERGLKVIVEK